MSSKRASVTVSSPRQAKRARSDGEEVRARTTAIAKALKDDTLPTNVPHAARAMLAAGASCALGSVVEERHAMQTMLIDNIREVFTEVSNGFKAKVAEVKQELDKKAVDLEEMKSKIQVANAESDQAGGKTNVDMEHLSSKEALANEAELKAKEARAKQKANNREKDAFDKEKAKYTAIEEGNLKALIEGSLTDEKEIKKAATKLVKDMEKIGADEALLASVPHVLTMKPAERKGFDNMVIESLRAHVAGKQNTIDEKIAANQQTAVVINEEVPAADQAAAAAKKDEADASESLEKAKALHVEKIAAQTSLESAADECRSGIETCSVAAKRAEDEVMTFQEVINGLDFLTNRSKAAMEAAEQETTAVVEEAAVPA